MAAWTDEVTLIALTEADERVNDNGFENKAEETARTVFCNMLSVGHSEYFESEQAGRKVEAKLEIHRADYGGEDVAELGGRRFYILKTYVTGIDTVELTLTDLKYKDTEA